jgi:hypothetical protein
MKSKATFAVFIIGIALLLAVASALAQRPAGDANPPTDTGAPKQRPGFLEFALRGINSTDRNYGACVDDARRLLLEETIRRAYFWSNLLAIAVAICLFLIVVHQHRAMARRDWMVADVITQYRNALARAEDQVGLATHRNHELMQALAAASGFKVEESADSGERTRQRKTTATVALSGAPAAAPSLSPPSVGGAKRAEESTAPAPSQAATTDTTTKSLSPGNQMGLFGSEGDFVAKINTLQQQLNTSQERERQLRRQLNDSEIRHQKEREKSRSPQG